MTPVYLKPNVAAEPLVAGWHAWLHTISPPTAAMYVGKTQLQLLDSYLEDPETHARASMDRGMLGGHFLDLDTSRVEEVLELKSRMVTRASALLELQQAIDHTQKQLLSEADGSSLEPLYRHLPEPLRGRVELVYDVAHQASLRFIEPLFYRSRFYLETLQELALLPVKDDQRPFVLSTPRLAREGMVKLSVSFSSRALSRLLQMRWESDSYEDIKDELAIEAQHEGAFRALFTTQVPSFREPYRGEGTRVMYMGHACVLLESKRTTVLIDPLIAYGSGRDSRRFTYLDLPPSIDTVVITHGHQDHFCLEALLQIRHRVKRILVPRSGGGYIEDPSPALALRNLGFDNVEEVGELQRVSLPGGEIIAVPFIGEHGDLRVNAKLGYCIRLEDVNALFVADSNNLDAALYKNVRAAVGSCDTVFVGMECVGGPVSWLHGCLLATPLTRKKDRTRRFTGSNAAAALELSISVGARSVFVYAMGLEPWTQHLTSLNYEDNAAQLSEVESFLIASREAGLTAELLSGCRCIAINASSSTSITGL